jgi:hypothetical protein
MRQQLTERLEQLKQEQQAGQKMLADLDTRQLDLQQTLLRISGAIQVIEELLANGPAADVPELEKPKPSQENKEPNK